MGDQRNDDSGFGTTCLSRWRAKDARDESRRLASFAALARDECPSCTRRTAGDSKSSTCSCVRLQVPSTRMTTYQRLNDHDAATSNTLATSPQHDSYRNPCLHVWYTKTRRFRLRRDAVVQLHTEHDQGDTPPTRYGVRLNATISFTRSQSITRDPSKIAEAGVYFYRRRRPKKQT